MLWCGRGQHSMSSDMRPRRQHGIAAQAKTKNTMPEIKDILEIESARKEPSDWLTIHLFQEGNLALLSGIF